MSNQSKKILLEFNLTPHARELLQDFMDKNIDRLSADNKDAKIELKDKILEIFPKEIIEELKGVFSGTSEYAILLHNTPEVTGLQNVEEPKANQTYSFHIGNALYEVCSNNSIANVIATRSSHRNALQNIPGLRLHRDSITVSKRDRLFGQHIIFSCPYNGEHAVIEITKLIEAIESLPMDTKNKVKVEITSRLCEDYPDTPMPPCTLSELLLDIYKPVSSDNFVRRVELSGAQNNYEIDDNLDHIGLFLEAIKSHSQCIDLQPGELLIVNENNMFHRANRGDEESIHKISLEQTHSRIILHNAAGQNFPRH